MQQGTRIYQVLTEFILLRSLIDSTEQRGALVCA
jgi:hypothetical protein